MADKLQPTCLHVPRLRTVAAVRFISSLMFKLLARNFTTTRMTSQNATQKIQVLIKENPVFIASKVSTTKLF
jgi:hypothetical protein